MLPKPPVFVNICAWLLPAVPLCPLPFMPARPRPTADLRNASSVRDRVVWPASLCRVSFPYGRFLSMQARRRSMIHATVSPLPGLRPNVWASSPGAYAARLLHFAPIGAGPILSSRVDGTGKRTGRRQFGL